MERVLVNLHLFFVFVGVDDVCCREYLNEREEREKEEQCRDGKNINNCEVQRKEDTRLRRRKQRRKEGRKDVWVGWQCYLLLKSRLWDGHCFCLRLWCSTRSVNRPCFCLVVWSGSLVVWLSVCLSVW